MDFDVIFLFSFLIFGGLCLLTALRLRKASRLFDSMVLYPGGLKKENCADPEGFMAYMRPRMAILGGIFVLVALVYALKMRVTLPRAASIAHIAVTAAGLAWAFWIYYRAGKLFW